MRMGSASTRWRRSPHRHERPRVTLPLVSVVPSVLASVSLMSWVSVEGLPVPVQRGLRRSGVTDGEVPIAVRVRQEGQIRTSPDGRWLRFTAEEDYTLNPPGFVWNASLLLAGIWAGRATDSFVNGRGRMRVKLFGAFTVVNACGDEMDQGSLMRWLNETMWFPAVWATETISWAPVNDHVAIGSVAVGDLTASAEFHFDDGGRLVDFRADRFRGLGSTFEMTPWSTPLVEHRDFHGVELPSVGSAIWTLEHDDFEYIRIRVTDVSYSPRA